MIRFRTFLKRSLSFSLSLCLFHRFPFISLSASLIISFFHFYLSSCLSISLSISISLHVYLLLSFSLDLFPSLFVCMFINRSLSISLSISLHVYLLFSFHVSISLYSFACFYLYFEKNREKDLSNSSPLCLPFYFLKKIDHLMIKITNRNFLFLYCVMKFLLNLNNFI